jgi:hypothetical protein
MYRLCLLGPTGRIAKVRRYWAITDDGAISMAREVLRDDPTLIGFQLWDGSRSVAEERRRAGPSPPVGNRRAEVDAPRGPARRRSRT